MRKLKLVQGRRALAVVAHPDDETIWLGGTILLNPKVRWTIFCLSRKSDQDRRPKFERVCARYGAEAIISDLDDCGRLSLKRSIPVIKRLLTLKLKNRRFAYCFTHGENGEYGHLRHIGIHQALKAWDPRRRLKCSRIFAFNYQKAPKGRRPSMVMAKDSDYFLKLSPKIFAEKKAIQSLMHGYPYNGIDNSLCTRTEGFKLI